MAGGRKKTDTLDKECIGEKNLLNDRGAEK